MGESRVLSLEELKLAILGPFIHCHCGWVSIGGSREEREASLAAHAAQNQPFRRDTPVIDPGS